MVADGYSVGDEPVEFSHTMQCRRPLLPLIFTHDISDMTDKYDALSLPVSDATVWLGIKRRVGNNIVFG